ncbi:hypothetical protein EVAR_56494_1 [Eumeta japonica]|uniref:Uncharacterized protein n=1 Tax=Eumeta variegata TaxID=151549 RepID=A0A4C1XJP3_EUMVA|nr:hypothetical protein EVAR_56494_1 [Eumeta japonica]
MRRRAEGLDAHTTLGAIPQAGGSRRCVSYRNNACRLLSPLGYPGTMMMMMQLVAMHFTMWLGAHLHTQYTQMKALISGHTLTERCSATVQSGGRTTTQSALVAT